MTEAGKLFVGGLNSNTDEQSLEEVFSKYGQISEVEVIKDKDTMASRGFSFITFKNPGDARDALQAMNGKSLDGHQIQVGHAKKRSGGGHGYGQGGYSDSYGHSGCRRGAGGGYWDSDRKGGYSGGGRYNMGDWDSYSGGYKGQGGYYYGGGGGYGGSYRDYD